MTTTRDIPVAFYNDTDRHAAAWLRELIAHGHIMEGTVDERSIAELGAHDLRGFTRVHFFAGIGGWDYALKLAGWPDDRAVWTGSCPCQPFSSAGRRGAEGDERHLWPEFYRLIAECRPPVVFGEQVASKAGRAWLAGVRADLESLGYSVGAADLCAACVGAPHIRQRLYWVADAQRGSAERSGFDMGAAAGGVQGPARERQRVRHDAGHGGDSGGLADAQSQRDTEEPEGDWRTKSVRCGDAGWLGDTERRGLQGRDQRGAATEIAGARCCPRPWDTYDLIPCRDGKSRRIEPGSFPLAHGVPARVGRLRGYGNAIVPQVAAEFVRAYIETKA